MAEYKKYLLKLFKDADENGKIRRIKELTWDEYEDADWTALELQAILFLNNIKYLTQEEWTAQSI